MDVHAAAITVCVAAAAGVFLIAAADRLKVPSIALLLFGGVLLGPQVLGIVDPGTLGNGLEAVVMLAVAVILFEGGLTLDIAGFLREPKVIIRLLTVGVLITWFGAAAAVYMLYDVSVSLALIAGSLVIVTGPTVVSPILRRIGVQPRLHQILYWEGVLVDAVGVFIAVLCFEWFASKSDLALLSSLGRFALRVAIGAGVGLLAGMLLRFVLRRRWIPGHHVNIVVLGTALLALGVANSIVSESGILAVIVAGLTLSLQKDPQLKQLKQFKLELTELGVGLLFILLVARLDLALFVTDAWRLSVFVGLVLFLVRPLNILASTRGQRFSWREKAFLSWLAPRGIVAASMASLFALKLAHLGYQEAWILESLTYAIIAATVLVQGLSAGPVARALGLLRSSRAAWLFIGDPVVGLELHRQLRQIGGRSIVLAAEEVHTNERGKWVDQMVSDPLRADTLRDSRLGDVEAVLALARDPAVNDAICASWSKVLGASACYRWDEPGEGARSDFGRLAWEDLAGPGTTKAALEANTQVLESLEVGTGIDVQRFGSEVRPLFAVEGGQISLLESDEVPEGVSVVALRKRTPGLYGLIRDAVIIDTHKSTFEEVMRGLLTRAAQAIEGLPVEEHLQTILQREGSMPTTVGHGVGIPHIYDERADRSVCFVASAVRGLDITGPDEEPVYLLFLVISPEAQATEHLHSLAAVAHLASDVELQGVLRAQETRGRFLALLRERE